MLFLKTFIGKKAPAMSNRCNSDISLNQKFKTQLIKATRK